MIAGEAKAIAEQFIAVQEMRGHTIKLVEVKDLPRWPHQWSVVFDLFSPAGNLIDGPIIVIVDKANKEARFFEFSAAG